jgi:hypothetical protein
MARKIPRPFKYFWGGGQIVEEATCMGEHSESALQLLRYEDGDHDGYEAVRFCFYNAKGAFQRHPLMLDREDIAKLRDALKDAPTIRAMLQELVAD